MGILNKLSASFDESKKNMKNTAGAIKPENVPNTIAKMTGKVGKTVENTLADAIKTAKETDPKDMGKNIMEMPGKLATAITKHHSEQKESQKSAEAIIDQKEITVPSLTLQDALMIIYLLMSVDSRITPEEKQTFESVGKEMDPEYEDHKEDIYTTCEHIIQEAGQDGDYIQNIHDYIAKIIWNTVNSGRGTVSSKLLIWDLEAIACADGSISNEEQNIIRFAAKELKIDHTVVLEMEHAIDTLMAISREEQWLKSSDRAYSAVDSQMKELQIRRETILHGVQALLAD